MERITPLQVDDSLGFGTSEFLDAEEKASTRFKSKPLTELTEEPVSFNGITVHKLKLTTKMRA